MELNGKIIVVMPVLKGVSSRTGNPWMSQEYVIETLNGQYPRKCVFRLFGEDRIKQFNIQQGEELTVHFDIDAHEYNGRWFNEIRAYNVTREQSASITSAPTAASVGTSSSASNATAPFPPSQEPTSEDTTDDLPF